MQWNNLSELDCVDTRAALKVLFVGHQNGGFAESAETKLHAAGDQTSITCETDLNGGEMLLLLGHTLECWHRGREY